MIYFIGDEHGRIKIGYSNNNVAKRHATQQIGNADQLLLLGIIKGGRKKESELHHHFSHNHIRGEWFIATPNMCEELKALDPSLCRGIEEWQKTTCNHVATHSVAHQILNEAKREARHIIANAHKEAKTIQRYVINERRHIIDMQQTIVSMLPKDFIVRYTAEGRAHIFGCRCVQCGQPLPDVIMRIDGFRWCNMCWTDKEGVPGDTSLHKHTLAPPPQNLR